MGIDLPIIWAVIILFALMMYVVMDGFDLGIGMLFAFVTDADERDLMVHAVAPIWDGNETWLVLGGAGLLAAFPLAYSVLLSAFYLPILLMLLGLIFRGVAFEFRFKATPAHRRAWDAAFFGGSLVAALAQGVILGAFIDGVPVVGRAYGGSQFAWLTAFSVFTGFGLLIAYALLGCTWLIYKTRGVLQTRMVALARPFTWALISVIAMVSVTTPLRHPVIFHRWSTLPASLWFAPVPLLVAAAAWRLLRSLRAAPQLQPFGLTLGLIFLCYSGFGISLWPNIVPPSISVREAAGSAQSLGFTLVGALLIIPMTLVYTAWGYYVFRGKVEPFSGH